MLDDNQIVATTPTACGIETGKIMAVAGPEKNTVATTPTACGIETVAKSIKAKGLELQQHLPLAVLKLFKQTLP